jgi:hypothetical protein
VWGLPQRFALSKNIFEIKHNLFTMTIDLFSTQQPMLKPVSLLVAVGSIKV